MRVKAAIATKAGAPLSIETVDLDGPRAGEWHAEWQEERLAAWKEVVRQLLTHHAARADSALGQISMEIIPAPDYGGGAKYSLLENNIACAKWIRAQWAEIQCAASAAA